MKNVFHAWGMKFLLFYFTLCVCGCWTKKIIDTGITDTTGKLVMNTYDASIDVYLKDIVDSSGVGYGKLNWKLGSVNSRNMPLEGIQESAVTQHAESASRDYVSIMPGVNIAGCVFLAEGCYLGTGCSIVQGKNVGKYAKVGAGAVVIEDVPPYSTVVGVPAKVVEKKK